VIAQRFTTGMEPTIFRLCVIPFLMAPVSHLSPLQSNKKGINWHRKRPGAIPAF